MTVPQFASPITLAVLPCLLIAAEGRAVVWMGQEPVPVSTTPGAAEVADDASSAPEHVSTVADQGQGTPPRRGTILIVDDARTVRELERSILERAGYEVRTAGDGIEALARLGEESADLVLTDVEMPRMDGFVLTEAIRAHPALVNVSVLIISSRSSEEDRRRGLEVGADGYIVKSTFDETALLGTVERLLGRRSRDLPPNSGRNPATPPPRA